MGIVHFTVHGDFITDFARTRYRETGDINVGIKFLQNTMNSPEGEIFPYDIAKAIVKGSKQLVGKDEFSLQDDDKKIIPECWIKPISIEECVRSGFIAPDGSFYGTDDSENLAHLYLAQQITKTIDKEEGNYKCYGWAIDYDLEANGYVRVRDYNNVMLSPACEQKVTEEQMLAIVKLAHALRSKQGRKDMRFGCNGDVRLSPYQLNNLEPLMWDKHLKSY